ncbi:uncharacterized protein LOC134152835 [Rhea pennata]|uniref:uncharacterized protein LOC134152835 n=1 Tax=Rhea pennata TaxID=8795 RepID=UPI002E25DA07
MAAKISAESLRDEASCSICLEVFQDPVSIHCGHSFCRVCITRCWEGLTANFSCPQCRKTVPKKSLRPNRELASIIEVTKHLSLQTVRGGNLCKKHQEVLKLFCEEEQMLICVVCDRSKVHRSHSVVPVDEAAQEYKEQIQIRLRALKEEQEILQASRMAGERRVQAYIKKREAERQKIITEFKQLHKFLEKQELLLLAHLEQLDKEILKSEKEVLSGLLEKIAGLSTLIEEMEMKCQQPACELLQDIRNTLSRCEREKIEQPREFSPELVKKFCDLSKNTSAIKKLMEEFQDLLEHKLRLASEPNTCPPVHQIQSASDAGPEHGQSQPVPVGGLQDDALGRLQVLPSGLQRFDIRLVCSAPRLRPPAGWWTWRHGEQRCEAGCLLGGIISHACPVLAVLQATLTVLRHEGVGFISPLCNEKMSMLESGTPPTSPSSRKAKLVRSSLGGRLARAMETQSPAENLHREASCSICLEYFQDPVSIHCGHNFCRACIACCWEGLETNFSCPQCRQTARQKSFRPSRELANIAEIARQLSLRAARGTAGWESLCKEHQEVLKLFCKEDQKPICVVCDRSQAHRFHTVVPVEEAAQEYKGKIQTCLQAFKEEREKFLENRKCGERKSSYLEKTKDEGKKIVCEFEHLHQFLKAQERLLLTQLADLNKAITKLQEEATTKITEEVSHLDTLIWEMEGKFQQPASKFLQEIRSLLSSCEQMKFNPPVEISPELERRLEEFVQKNILVRYTLRKCQDSLMFKLQEPTNVTLDPATAHPNLHLSEDQKEARGQLIQQDLPDNPERFDFEPCVLGCEGFTSGKHFWEVEVGQGGVWALGVARESVKRKGQISLTPKEGVWALEAYYSLTSPHANLHLNTLPRRIRVSLDYEAGRVAFFSTDDESPILVYTTASFNSEKVVPWFKMGIGTRLQEITRHPPSEDPSVARQPMSPLDWVGFRSPLRICP